MHWSRKTNAKIRKKKGRIEVLEIRALNDRQRRKFSSDKVGNDKSRYGRHSCEIHQQIFLLFDTSSCIRPWIISLLPFHYGKYMILIEDHKSSLDELGQDKRFRLARHTTIQVLWKTKY